MLYGISNYDFDRLKRIQNSATRIVANTGKFDHITLILHKLYWLSVRQRIFFMILLTTYKLSMTWHLNTSVNCCPLESHPENSGAFNAAAPACFKNTPVTVTFTDH